MHRFAIALSGLLVLALAGPATVGAQPGSNKVSIKAEPNPVTYLRSTVISGRVTGPDRGGQTVELEEDPYPFADNGFERVATTTSRSDGTYGGPGVAGFTRQPLLNTRYRVVARTSPPATSDIVTVLVRMRVTIGLSDSTPRRGSRVRFSGTVRPDHDGATARIQRRARDGDWVTVARTTLLDVPGEDRSRYSRRVRVRRDGTYRVRVPGDADHATGTSRRRRIDVH